MFYIWLESLEDLISNGTGLMNKLVRSHRESSASPYLAFGPCIVLEPIRAATWGVCTPLITIYSVDSSTLGFGFCLYYSVKNSFAAVSICETPTHEINLSSSNLVAIFLVLACVL